MTYVYVFFLNVYLYLWCNNLRVYVFMTCVYVYLKLSLCLWCNNLCVCAILEFDLVFIFNFVYIDALSICLMQMVHMVHM
jgi:hypothetical protein